MIINPPDGKPHKEAVAGGMISKILVLASIIGLLLPVTYFFSIWSGQFRHEADYKITLKYFRTITVALEFKDIGELEKVFDYSRGDLKGIILKKVADGVNARFGNEKIKVSEHGHPYDFKSNPLNLELVFHVVKLQENPKKYSLYVNIKRSKFFAAFLDSIRGGGNNEMYKKTYNAINSRNIQFYTEPVIERRVEEYKRLPGVVEVNEQQKLVDAFGFVSVGNY